MAIIGDLSIEASDGTILTASNDLTLAWLWAEHEHGSAWSTFTYGKQCREVADARSALRDAFNAG